MEHASEDMRKLAQVTGMIGINSKSEFKKNGVIGLNWTPLREDEFNDGRFVYFAQCLALGNPCVLSCFRTEDEDEEVAPKNRLNGKRNGRREPAEAD